MSRSTPTRLGLACLFFGSLLFAMIVLISSCQRDRYHTGSAAPPLVFTPFPWPPPAASATEVVPHAILDFPAVAKTLGDVDSKLASALNINGYRERRYYAVPDGFALVTRLEQIEKDGRSKQPPARWKVKATWTDSGIRGLLKALLTANPGRFRVIVFILTDIPFTQTEASVSENEAVKWLSGGMNVLPPQVEAISYSKRYDVTVLIYEFEKTEDKSPQCNHPSRLGAHEHLEKSGLWAALSGAP